MIRQGGRGKRRKPASCGTASAGSPARDCRTRGHPLASRSGAQGRLRPEHRKRRGSSFVREGPGAAGHEVGGAPRCVTLVMGSMVAVGAAPIWCGVGPAGVGTWASRLSSLSSAAWPSSTAARSSSVSGIVASMCCRVGLGLEQLGLA
jgi:hypothetical protein